MSDIESRLVAYADGELDAADVAEIERIIATDPNARRSVEIYRSTAALLRAACAESVYAAPARPLAIAPPRPAAPWRSPLAIAASVALLLVGFGGGWAVAPHPAEAGFIDDVAEYHAVYSRETTHLAEVPASQSDEIARWLGARLQRPVAAPDLHSVGLQFAGARMWISEGKPVADMLYTRNGGPPVALCIVHEAGTNARHGDAIQLTTRGDLRVAYWVSNGYTFAVVGELTPAQAEEIAQRARHLSET